MKKKYLIVLLFSVAISTTLFAQKKGVFLLTKQDSASLRGMSIPTDEIVWVSGSKGTVGKSTNGGNTWNWFTVKGFEKSDFRDIEAFDSSTAVIMAIGDPAYILKTTDGGKSWRQVYKKSMAGMFLDAMDFKSPKEGICIGDPVAIGAGGRKFFFVVRTHDGGDTWIEDPSPKLAPAQQNGEGIFSASGTNIVYLNDNNPDFDYAFVTGGLMSNFYLMGREGKESKTLNLLINQGVESTGAFSLASDGKKKFFAIGGDYKEGFNAYDNYYYTTNAGKSWGTSNVAGPGGYRSCIRIIDGDKMVSCGTNGVDYTKDGGNDWKSMTTEGFNVCGVSPTKKIVFLAGDKGKIGKLIY